jgi:hypothetical protein
MESSTCKRFRFSFFEDEDSPRNGLDIEALRLLEGEERTRAEEMLLGYLPDIRGAIGLGELRTARAEPALTGILEAMEELDSKSTIIYLAKALWQIRPDPSWLDAMLQVLTFSRSWQERVHAAVGLKVFRDPAAVSALTNALDDPDHLVRYHATRSLLAIHGLDNYPACSSPHNLDVRVMSKDPVVHEGAKKEILASISGRPMAAR